MVSTNCRKLHSHWNKKSYFSVNKMRKGLKCPVFQPWSFFKMFYPESDPRKQDDCFCLYTFDQIIANTLCWLRSLLTVKQNHYFWIVDTQTSCKDKLKNLIVCFPHLAFVSCWITMLHDFEFKFLQLTQKSTITILFNILLCLIVYNGKGPFPPK